MHWYESDSNRMVYFDNPADRGTICTRHLFGICPDPARKCSWRHAPVALHPKAKAVLAQTPCRLTSYMTGECSQTGCPFFHNALVADSRPAQKITESSSSSHDVVDGNKRQRCDKHVRDKHLGELLTVAARPAAGSADAAAVQEGGSRAVVREFTPLGFKVYTLPDSRAAVPQVAPHVPASNAAAPQAVPHVPTVVAEEPPFIGMIWRESNRVTKIAPCDLPKDGEKSRQENADRAAPIEATRLGSALQKAAKKIEDVKRFTEE